MDSGMLIAVLALAAALVALALVLRRRRPDQLETPKDLALENADPNPGLEVTEQLSGLEPNQVMLVPLPGQEDQAVALGSEGGLATLEAEGLLWASDSPSKGPLPQLARNLLGGGGLEATRRANTGIEQGRIVALSDQTMKAMQTHRQAYDKAGNALGLLRDKKGFSHVVRFDKAGAKAMTASNAAVLVVTAALSQQLASIEEQLAEIQTALRKLVEDGHRERLATVRSTNDKLRRVAADIERHGEMTADDWRAVDQDWSLIGGNVAQTRDKLTKVMHRIENEAMPSRTRRLASKARGAIQEAIDRDDDLPDCELDEPSEIDRPRELNRKSRAELLEKLVEEDDLYYWLALMIEAEVAETRRDLLYLYWEQLRYPTTAHQVAEQTHRKMDDQCGRVSSICTTLQELADPENKTLTDPVRILSRRRLNKRGQELDQLLAHKVRFGAGTVAAGGQLDVGRPPAAQPVLLELSAEGGQSSAAS